MSTTTSKARHPGRLPGRFNDLMAMLPPRVIRDETDYDNAIEMIEKLTSIPALTNGQGEYLETLSVLVEAYEAEHHAIDTSHITPREMVVYLCEQNDMTASALGGLLGNRSLGSKLLRGEREPSKAHIRILCERFKVTADLFLATDAC